MQVKMQGRGIKLLAAVAALLLVGVLLWAFMRPTAPGASGGDAVAAPRPPDDEASAAARPALTVTATSAEPADWPQTLAANGSVAAWQEAVVGAEIGGLRLTEVLVNVGDRVKRGQVLARMSGDTVQADLAQNRAALAEARATLAAAEADAERARQLQSSGAISAQQINQYLTSEQTARARVEAQKARLEVDTLRLRQTRVLAPDDGVISARTATVGSVAQAGAELFRLIRGGRLEWRAEVTPDEMARLTPGMKARLFHADGGSTEGTVRTLAPTVDPQTRYGLVYVDLPATAHGAARAGSFARGEFDFGRRQALTLPQSAVLLRDGFSVVLRIGEDGRLTQTKITVGRRVGDRVEVLAGLKAGERVVATGGGFLGDGDLVRVAPKPAA